MATDTTSPQIRTDQVDHPGHYTDHPSGIECIELLRGRESRLSNVIKYLWRADTKHDTPEVDVRKAHWYLRDYLAAPTMPLVNHEAGELTPKRRVIAECTFRDWFNHPDSVVGDDDRIVMAVIDHDHEAAKLLLVARLREFTAR